ncbi:MAG TPA: hypothetical protein DCZ02_04355 [Ruminococcaceae bacterium]|nr:hypothetical protein [Oscillospiraceae bacterium]
MDREWIYKIRSDKTGLLLMFVMAAIFSSVTLWLYKSNNGAFIFVLAFSILLLILLLAGIYRGIFYKVFISSDGFYYQTGIGNGNFYPYTEVEKAWINTGSAQNGSQIDSCNIALRDQKVIRFTFSYKDEDAVEYLIETADAYAKGTDFYNETEKDEYIIDGKFLGKTRIILSIIILAIIVFLDAFFIKLFSMNFVLIPSIIIGIGVVLYLFNYYLFFKIKIEKNGFYYRTTPFNARCYEYGEITSCRKIRREARHYSYHNGTSGINYYFYFEFTDNTGKKHKFQYDQQIHEYEVDILKQRIETHQ